MIDLTAFCGKATALSESASATDLTTPWSDKTYTYATNGHILVRVPVRSDVPSRDNAPIIKNVLGNFFDEIGPQFVKLPEFPADLIKKCKRCDGRGLCMECPRCEGTGEDECSECGNLVDCFECEGYGFKDATIFNKEELQTCQNCYGIGSYADHHLSDGSNDRTDFALAHGRAFSSKYLALLSAKLPNIRIAIEAKDKSQTAPSHFVFDGGEGLLMPMRYEEESYRLYQEAKSASSA